MKRSARVLILLFLCGSPVRAFAGLQQVQEVHYQMGTFLEITLWDSEPDHAKHLIREAVQEVHRLDEILSNYDRNSSVSRLNRLAGKGRTTVPSDLYDLLKLALKFSVETAGYFDITVGPLVELWRESLSAGVLPDRDSLSRVLRQVGYDKLKLYGGEQAELVVSGMKIDLGGIGKGYAVDRVVDRFSRAGVHAALINFGGSSMFAMGTPPGQPGWEIGIKGPDDRVRGLIYLRDIALSTSGSMGKFWTIGGQKYGHLIDPKNGAAASEPRMATTITPTATGAEALTKPLVLLGRDALRIVARLAGAEAAVIPENGPLFFTGGFKSKTGWQEIPRL